MKAADGVAAWLRLAGTRGVGPDAARRLLSAFGLPENIFAAGMAAVQRVVPDAVARALTDPVEAAAAAAI